MPKRTCLFRHIRKVVKRTVMSDEQPSGRKWYKDPILYVIIFLSCFFVIFILVLVNLPAPSDWLILDSESSNIGSAIGGVGTVVVGILNIIMLYLTFKSQNDKLELTKYLYDKQIKELQRRVEDEEKNNKYRKIKKKFDKIYGSWSSKKILLSERECSINNYFLLLEGNNFDDNDSKIIGEEILAIFSRLINILDELSKIEEEPKNELLQDIKDFYEDSMKPKYDVIINAQDEVIKEKLQKKNSRIETYIIHFQNNE
jgi:hypothetical protein